MMSTNRHRLLTASLLLALTNATVACNTSGPDEATASARSAAIVETVLNVEGMHCATCPVTVKTAAEGVDGVTAVRVRMDDARAWVTFDPAKTDARAIAAAITESGYKAAPEAVP